MQDQLEKHIRSPKNIRKPFRYLKHIAFLLPFVWRGIGRHKQPQYLKSILKLFRNLAEQDKPLDDILRELETAEKKAK